MEWRKVQVWHTQNIIKNAHYLRKIIAAEYFLQSKLLRDGKSVSLQLKKLWVNGYVPCLAASFLSGGVLGNANTTLRLKRTEKIVDCIQLFFKCTLKPRWICTSILKRRNFGSNAAFVNFTGEKRFFIAWNHPLSIIFGSNSHQI